MTAPHQQSHETSELTFHEHLSSLRRTVLTIFGMVIGTSVVIHLYITEIVDFLLAPLGAERNDLQFLTPLDPLLFILKIDFTLALLLTLPVTILLIWRFIAPHTMQRGYVPYCIVLSSTLLGSIAAIYSYTLVIPIVIGFMSSLVLPGTTLAFTAHGYLGFVLSTTGLLVLVFQIPLLIIGLCLIGVLTPDAITKNRPYIYTATFVFSAFITPTTDIFTLFLIVLPALLVTEGGAFIARLFIKRTQTAHETEYNATAAGTTTDLELD
jgi:sec-independent protein translocase protein TatC